MRDSAGIMEIGSDSLGCASGSDDLLNGIKLGEKIYFENAGSVVNCSPSGPVVSAAASSLEQDRSSSKKGRGVTIASQPPRCQVEGCNVDLTGLKTYYCRHKVCGMHSKFPKVIVGGLEQRFCQQCSRFHLLAEFDQGKRSCRRRLAGHNERRRKPHSSSLVSSNFSHAASFLREDESRMRGFWDYPYSRLPAGQTVWHSSIPVDHGTCNEVTSTVKFLPNMWQGSFNSSAMGVSSGVPQPYLQGTLDWISVPASNAPASGECFAPVSASGGALSLLSTEPHSRRTRSFGLNGYGDGDGHSFASQDSVLSNTTTTSSAWSFRSHETDGSSDDLTLQQLPSTCNSDRFQMNWSL